MWPFENEQKIIGINTNNPKVLISNLGYSEVLERHTKKCETQIGGAHYKNMTIQPIQFITQNKLGFCEGNVIKYLCRFREKGGKEDLLKAKHYIDLLIESEYGDKK